MRLRQGHAMDIFFAIAVNCVWGLAFVIPTNLTGVDSAAVALGRYFIYGILSAGILLVATRQVRFGQIHWFRAFAYAFLGHVGYYIVLVWAISLGGVMVVAPIMATLPVSVAITGNLLSKELSFKRLILPLLFILAGIAYLRVYQNSHFTSHGIQPDDMIYGALLAVAALAMWTMYAVLNARYLKRSQVSSVAWAQAMGFCCLLQVALVISIRPFFYEQPGNLFSWANDYELAIKFALGIVILGVLVSWASTQVWNKVSRKLPITVSGQLLVVQSLAAILYDSWLDGQAPQPIEMACIALVVVGVVWGVKSVYEPRPEPLAHRDA